MSRRVGRSEAKGTPSARVEVPQKDWDSFIEGFNRRHQGWLVRLETHDLVTRERVVSSEMSLQAIEFDLEDEKNPRINVIVQFDNKVVKHILFLPSRVVQESSDEEGKTSLQVQTVNTETTIHLRARALQQSD